MVISKEILTACALSFGAKISSRLSKGGLMITTSKRRSPYKFDPENDSNDALMLAIYHQMDVFVGTYGAEVVCEKVGIDSVFCENKDDPALAVRCAIIRVSARIHFKEKKGK